MANERISDIRIERVALELLDQYSITDPGFEIEDLAEAEGLEVRRGELKNIDAWLVRKPEGGGIIRLRDDTPEAGRVRFSIAHEIGHWFLHPRLSQGFLFLCTQCLVGLPRSGSIIGGDFFCSRKIQACLLALFRIETSPLNHSCLQLVFFIR